MNSEKDPNGLNQHAPGAKLDAGKSPVLRGLIQYFPRAGLAKAMLSAWGANKYTWKGWETVPDGVNRYGDALMRHLIKETTEGPFDLEILNDLKHPAYILHATQVSWNADARLELMLQEMEKKQ